MAHRIFVKHAGAHEARVPRRYHAVNVFEVVVPFALIVARTGRRAGYSPVVRRPVRVSPRVFFVKPDIGAAGGYTVRIPVARVVEEERAFVYVLYKAVKGLPPISKK